MHGRRKEVAKFPEYICKMVQMLPLSLNFNLKPDLAAEELLHKVQFYLAAPGGTTPRREWRHIRQKT
jgi:hypothetical protein